MNHVLLPLRLRQSAAARRHFPVSLSATIFAFAMLVSQSHTQTAGPAKEENFSTTSLAANKSLSGEGEIRPFHIHVSDEALADLRRRLAETRWPDQETVGDPSQGVQLATMKELVHYWQTDYDWRKGEARLNALPQFVTTIDGVDIYFIHVRSRHPNALPLIMTHG